MKTEFLKELGLEQEAIDKIMAENGKDVQREKDLLQTITAERDTLQTQLSEANTTIQGYKDMDVDSIKQSAADWETKYNKAVEESQAAEKRRAMETAIADLAFSSQSAKRAFMQDLEAAGLPLQEGKILGLSDFTADYKKNDPGAIVEADAKPPRFVGGGKPAQMVEVTPETFQAMGYNDRLKLKTEQPETYEALAGTKG